MIVGVAFVAAFAAVALCGVPAIGALKRLSFRQQAYEDAPQSHAVKSGTPTMGGVLFPLALVVACICIATLGRAGLLEFAEIAALALACAAIGFADDYSAIVRGRNRGLDARTKFGLTIVAAVAFLAAVGSGVIWYDVLALLAILGTTHAVNLTDGLDGLAAGTIVPALLVLAFLAYGSGHMPACLVLVATAGACCAFLLYNRHPARLFMGDTGSLFLGAVLAGSAVVAGQVLLLPLLGAVFAAEALSVIIQVTYFKRTGGKRIFKMTPLHHHFELSGWSETAVTRMFWLASLVSSLLGLAVAMRAGGTAR